MLHGFVQSDKIFSSKTGGLRKSLKKLGYELCYPCGTELITKEVLHRIHGSPQDISKQFNTTIKEDAADDDEENKLYGWWIKNSDGVSFEIKQNTLDYLHNYVIENGPFDGIIGFSQGAGLAGYLATDFNGLLDLTLEQQPPLKFFISFSGFRLEPASFQHNYNVKSIQMPSLHVQGELDTVVSEQRVMKLYETCPEETRTLLKHPGGHFVPNSKQFVSQVCNWIVSMTRASKESTTEKKTATSNMETPDLDDDLMDMIDSFGKI